MFDLPSISVSDATAWLAAAAFFIGGAVNAAGSKSIRDDFLRYGFPSWWCWVTAVLEIAAAVLLLIPSTVSIGVALGAIIMCAAIVSVVRARSFRHLPPPALYLLLLIVTAITRL